MSMQTLLAFARVRFTLAAMILGVNSMMLWRLKQNVDIPSFIGLAYVFFFDLGAPLVSLFLVWFYFIIARKMQKNHTSDILYTLLFLSWFPYFQLRLKNAAWEPGSSSDLLQLLYRFIGR